MAHELRNLISIAIFAFEVLKTGNVGVAGSTGTVLHRSLMSMRALIARSLRSVSRRASRIGSNSSFPHSSKSSRRRLRWKQTPGASD
jgi:hypothetical protein